MAPRFTLNQRLHDSKSPSSSPLVQRITPMPVLDGQGYRYHPHFVLQKVRKAVLKGKGIKDANEQ